MDHLADQAPHPADIRAALTAGRAYRPRRTTAILATAVVTATAAVAAVVVPHVISHGRSDSATQDKRDTAWSRWVDLNLPKNIQAVGQVFTQNRQDYEMVDVVQQTWPTFCQLQLHRNGDFDPATIPAGSTPTDISGHEAWIVSSTPAKPFLPAPQAHRFPLFAAVQKTLAWQPVDGVWALLSCESQRKLGTVRVPTIDGAMVTNVTLSRSLAESFAPPTGSLGSPVKLGELPQGVTPRQIDYAPYEKGIPGGGESFSVLLSDGNPATGYVHKPPTRSGPPLGANIGVWDPALGDDLRIRYSTDQFWNLLSRYPDRFKPDAIIHGMKAYYYTGQIQYSQLKPSTPPKLDKRQPVDTIRLEGNGASIEIVSLAKTPSKDDLRRVAESLEVTKHPKTPSTWFDASTAIG